MGAPIDRLTRPRSHPGTVVDTCGIVLPRPAPPASMPFSQRNPMYLARYMDGSRSEVSYKNGCAEAVSYCAQAQTLRCTTRGTSIPVLCRGTSHAKTEALEVLEGFVGAD